MDDCCRTEEKVQRQSAATCTTQIWAGSTGEQDDESKVRTGVPDLENCWSEQRDAAFRSRHAAADKEAPLMRDAAIFVTAQLTEERARQQSTQPRLQVFTQAFAGDCRVPGYWVQGPGLPATVRSRLRFPSAVCQAEFP